MTNMSWKEAIACVLKTTGKAMNYREIAEEIEAQGYRKERGANPAATVNGTISQSLKQEGDASPFIRVGRGEDFLRYYESADTGLPLSRDVRAPEPDEEELSWPIQAFGVFWERERVHWQSRPSLLGVQQIGADPVDFAEQQGVYVLYDQARPVYVGQCTEKRLAQRLFEHTLDRLRSRWSRFSWFGTLGVSESGDLFKPNTNWNMETLVGAIEAILIEVLEPPLNRRRGDNMQAGEYLQHEDPKIKKQRYRNLIKELEKSIGGD